MNRAWYCVENEVTVGPASLGELADRFARAKGEPFLVWTEGMSDWADAGTVPAISKSLQSLSRAAVSEAPGHRKATLAQRAHHELVEYAVISAYLFVCFGSLLFYKSAILRKEGIEFTAFGLALVKALILGKFILVLQAIKVGEPAKRSGILIVDIFKTSFLFLVFLVTLNAIEEIALGLFHGRAARDVLDEMAGGTLPEAVAVCVLLLLVLIPYFSFRGLASRLGEGVLLKHFTERGSDRTP
jgi:hypothetical protein